MDRPVLSEKTSRILLALLREYVDYNKIAERCSQGFTAAEIVSVMYGMVLDGLLRVDVLKDETGTDLFRVVTTDRGVALQDFPVAPVQGHA